MGSDGKVGCVCCGGRGVLSKHHTARTRSPACSLGGRDEDGRGLPDQVVACREKKKGCEERGDNKGMRARAGGGRPWRVSALCFPRPRPQPRPPPPAHSHPLSHTGSPSFFQCVALERWTRPRPRATGPFFGRQRGRGHADGSPPALSPLTFPPDLLQRQAPAQAPPAQFGQLSHNC